MLTMKEAARIGIDVCIDKIGRDFVMANRANGTAAYGEADDGVYCYVGVTDRPQQIDHGGLIVLDNESRFPYWASCNVSLEDGTASAMEGVSAVFVSKQE